MLRRQTFSDTAVSYAAVGCTQAADVMVFPPAGFRSTQDEYRLGSGPERFEAATAALMTWGVPRGAHLKIEHVSPADGQGYPGIAFTEFGAPIAPSEQAVESLFAPDGSAYLVAGESLELRGVFFPSRRAAHYRVIYVSREARRVGYAWGTLDDFPVVGEEFFGVEWREDDSVFSVVRTVTQVTQSKFSPIFGPVVRGRQWLTRRRYVRSLLPARRA